MNKNNIVRNLLFPIMILIHSSAWSAPVISVVSTDITAYPDGTGHQASILIRATGIESKEDKEPTVAIEDAGIDNNTKVTIDNAGIKYLGGDKQTHNWAISLQFQNLPEKGKHTRYLSIKLDDLPKVFQQYNVSAATADAFSWTIKGPTKEWLPGNNDTTAISITTGARQASNVRIVHSTLQRTDKQQNINAGDFDLCLDNDCDAPINLQAETTHTVSIRFPRYTEYAGQYEGSISVIADGASEAKDLQLSIYSSSIEKKSLGVILILIGVLAAWFVSVYARYRAARLSGLMPAALLREQLEDLREQKNKAETITGLELANIGTVIEELLADLAENKLTSEGFIPPAMPNPFTPFSANDKYKQYLKERSTRIAQLTLVIDRAVDYIVGHWNGLDAVQQQQAEPLLEQLDEAIALGDSTKIQAKVEEIVETFKGLLAQRKAQRSSQNAVVIVPEQEAPLPVQSIRVEQAQLNKLIWALWAVFTVIAGWGALILTNAGFGTPMDLFKCLLWGLGVQVAGQQLQQLGPGNISSAFRISVPAATR